MSSWMSWAAGTPRNNSVRIERTTLAEWQDIIDVNLTGVFLCCKYIGGAIGEGGSIINVSSVAGHGGLPRSGPYCASKGGVEMFSKALALDWARRNVRVNTLAPGWVDTNMSAPVLKTKRGMKEVVSLIPLRRVARPEEIAGPILFAASDLATFVTGEVINVNGGSLLCG